MLLVLAVVGFFVRALSRRARVSSVSTLAGTSLPPPRCRPPVLSSAACRRRRVVADAETTYAPRSFSAFSPPQIVRK